jgi:hypothetical protein
MLDHEEEGDEKAEVPNPIHDECFLAGGRSRVFGEPETDKQKRGQTHALPADEHHQVIAGQNQCEHEEHEQVQIGKEAIEAPFFPHIADRINVDHKADARDHQQHHQRKLVKIKGEIDLEAAGPDPGGERFPVRQL